MFYIKEINTYSNKFPDYPIIKRRSPLSFEELLKNKNLDEFDLKDELVFYYLEMDASTKEKINNLYLKYFFEFMFDNKKNCFYKIVEQQKIIFTEIEKDVLFIIINIFHNSNKTALLNFTHYINNSLFTIIKNENLKCNVISQDLNWILNFHKEFKVFINDDYIYCDQDNYKILCKNNEALYYVEGDNDYKTYSFFYPSLKFQIENGSSHILNLMNSINTKLSHPKSNKAILDKDALPEKAINILKKKNINVIIFSEIENFWLSENILKYFYETKDISIIKNKFFDYVEKNLENITNRFNYRQDFYKKLDLPTYSKNELDLKKKEILFQIKSQDYKSLLNNIDSKNIFKHLLKNQNINTLIDKANKKNKQNILQEGRKILNIGDLNE